MMTPPRGGAASVGDASNLVSPTAILATPVGHGKSPSAGEVVPATPEDVPLPRAPLSELRPLHDPNASGALVLCTAAEALSLGKGARGVAVVVDPFLARKLRPHQRQGVRWMYRAIHGFSPVSPESSTPPSPQVAIDRAGCLLADDMGLGKSLQSLALIWTMLRQGPHGVPTAARALLVCPASLVGNWGAEVSKWLGGVGAGCARGGRRRRRGVRRGRRARPRTPSASTSGPSWSRRTKPCAGSRRWRRRRGRNWCATRRTGSGTRRGSRRRSRRCARSRLPCAFCSPGRPCRTTWTVRGGDGVRVSRLARPRTNTGVHSARARGGEPGASARDIEEAGAARALAGLTQKRVLRREASINAAHLPAKTEIIVFCKPAEAQRALYEEGARVVREWTRGGGGGSTAAALCAIGLLRQLANSVDQAMGVGRLAALRAKAGRRRDDDEDDVAEEDETGRRKRARSEEASEDEERTLDETDVALGGSASASDASTADLRSRLASRIPKGFVGGAEGSGKLSALRSVVKALRDAGEGERVVIVSGFSAALDLAGAVCADLGVRTDRLDGRTPPDARSALVKEFNAGRGGSAMLLSCVAGGAGLNLVGASRLVLFDTSWNPAHDRQAMARVWRDGQTRPVTIYRLLAAGTVEEKVFQRQLLKRAEAEAVGVGDGGGDGANSCAATVRRRRC